MILKWVLRNCLEGCKPDLSGLVYVPSAASYVQSNENVGSRKAEIYWLTWQLSTSIIGGSLLHVVN